MRLLQLAVASALASSCSAVNLLVRGGGGNSTTAMMYGIMHEVGLPLYGFTPLTHERTHAEFE